MMQFFSLVPARPHIPRPFIDDDGEVGSTSEAGELDSMDSDNEGPTEFNNRSMAAGERWAWQRWEVGVIGLETASGYGKSIWEWLLQV